MASQSVVILTPNGRRQTVKVTPNMTGLDILEQVCKKHNFESNNYDLKHHKRILDLSQMFRFSGLPNNAQLEMIEAKKVRAEAADVVIVIQLEDGTRLTGTFKPQNYLQEVLDSLCPDISASEKNPVIIYMRKEVYGENLESTTLKSLGLMSGKAMLRLIHKTPEMLKVQANVSAPLISKPIPEMKEETLGSNQSQPSSSSVMSTHNDEMDVVQTKIEYKKETSQYSKDIKEESMEVDINNISARSPDNKKAKTGDRTETVVPVSESIIEEPEIIFLGDHNAVLFSLDAAQSVGFNDIPDSFFDLTVQDVRYLLRDLQKRTKGLDEAPLMTAKLREFEESKQILRKLEYKKTIIRIQFPDRLVLQGTFSPVDKIETIINFVREYLQNPDLNYHLYTTPPKQILAAESLLVEAKCVPQALLHFGIDHNSGIKDISSSFLKEDIKLKLTSPSGAILAASKARGLSHTGLQCDDSTQAGANGKTLQSGQKPKLPDNFQQSTATRDLSKETKVPKWFKHPK